MSTASLTAKSDAVDTTALYIKKAGFQRSFRNCAVLGDMESRCQVLLTCFGTSQAGDESALSAQAWSPRQPRKLISDLSISLATLDCLDDWQDEVPCMNLVPIRSEKALPKVASEDHIPGSGSNRKVTGMCDARSFVNHEPPSSNVSSREESPDFQISNPSRQASRGCLRTLSSIGKNHVTFSPMRASVKAESEPIRRVDGVKLDLSRPTTPTAPSRASTTVFTDASTCGSFKTVSLSKESVTEWFTGKSRERSVKMLPTIFEEDDDVSSEDIEYQQ